MSFFHCYRPHRFNSETHGIVDRANLIVSEMGAQGYTLTLRQLYYQFVARGLMSNEDREYKRLGRLVTRAREAGEMDWYAIEDRGRGALGTPTEEDPTEVVRGIEEDLTYDQWGRQGHYLEVWVEKSALEGVVARPCDRRHVTYMACRGYLSASEAWRAGRRFAHARRAEGKETILIHLADHDPSGLNMTDDNRDRLRMFAEDYDVEVRRIALNMDQVERYGPPPNPAKESDSRARAYVREFGPHSWELDALEPSVLDTLISDVIDEYVDEVTWAEVHEEQEEARRPLAALSENWDAVREFLHREGLV